MSHHLPSPETVKEWISTKSLGYNRAYAAAQGYILLAAENKLLKAEIKALNQSADACCNKGTVGDGHACFKQALRNQQQSARDTQISTGAKGEP